MTATTSPSGWGVELLADRRHRRRRGRHRLQGRKRQLSGPHTPTRVQSLESDVRVGSFEFRCRRRKGWAVLFVVDGVEVAGGIERGFAGGVRYRNKSEARLPIARPHCAGGPSCSGHRRPCGRGVHQADLVVDACGRRSPVPGWLIAAVLCYSAAQLVSSSTPSLSPRSSPRCCSHCSSRCRARLRGPSSRRSPS
jgi:hypothetical protein